MIFIKLKNQRGYNIKMENKKEYWKGYEDGKRNSLKHNLCLIDCQLKAQEDFSPQENAIGSVNGEIPTVGDIKTARRCMNFKLLRCDNKDCLNESCPLNKIYDNQEEPKMQFIKNDIVSLMNLAKDTEQGEAFYEKCQQDTQDEPQNPLCKCCGDNNSPSLSNRGWCIYCERAYEMGKKENAQDIKDAPKVIILDDNELSIMGYAEEFPENWKKICDALDKEKQDIKFEVCICGHHRGNHFSKPRDNCMFCSCEKFEKQDFSAPKEGKE